MGNLQNYIDNTNHALGRKTDIDKDRPLLKKLERNLWQALIVQKIGEYTASAEPDLGPILPLVPAPSVFGRMYYKGLSIQNLSKEVRSAVLGDHYQYDMNAAVYAVKLALLNELHGGENNLQNTSIGSYTREYLNNKNAIRGQLARKCFEGTSVNPDYAVKQIKAALTAIGFGARTSGGFWTEGGKLKTSSLNEILTSGVVRETFVEDPWVKTFIKEQKEIEKAILEAIKAEEDFEGTKELLKKDGSENGRVSDAMLLAYVFQTWETKLMDTAVEILQHHDIEVKARIHDAFIVGSKIKQSVLDEVLDAWSRYSSHITLDAERVDAWRPVEQVVAYHESRMLEEDHVTRMAHEEKMARIYSLKKVATFVGAGLAPHRETETPDPTSAFVEVDTDVLASAQKWCDQVVGKRALSWDCSIVDGKARFEFCRKVYADMFSSAWAA